MSIYFGTNFHYEYGTKYDIAFEFFPKVRKKISKVYKTGFHKWNYHNECTTYSLVVYTFRILIYKYNE